MVAHCGTEAAPDMISLREAPTGAAECMCVRRGRGPALYARIGFSRFIIQLAVID